MEFDIHIEKIGTLDDIFGFYKYPVEGVQFQPESIRMKPYGMQILKNFIEL